MCGFFQPKYPDTHKPQLANTSTTKCVDSFCKQHIISEYWDFLIQKIIHEGLIWFKIFQSFARFLCNFLGSKCLDIYSMTLSLFQQT